MTVDTPAIAVTSRRKYRVSGLGGKIIIGGTILVILGLIGVFAGVIAPYDPNQQDVFNRLASPSSALYGGKVTPA